MYGIFIHNILLSFALNVLLVNNAISNTPLKQIAPNLHCMLLTPNWHVRAESARSVKCCTIFNFLTSLTRCYYLFTL